MYRRLVRSLAGSLGGFAALASTGRSARACATWSAATAARGASAAQGALRVPDRASSLGHRGRGFAASGVLRNAAPPASTRVMVRGKTKGVGVHVGADGDVDRAMRKLKRVMINEGIEKNVKKRLVFLKGSDARVVAKRERDHRKWKKALRSKLGWIMRRKDRGF
jgi:ribosomal protein S21